MKNILVVFGGPSPENEISVITGLQAFEHIDRTKYNPIPLYISRENVMYVGPRIGTIGTYSNLPKLLAASTPVTITKETSGVAVRKRDGLFKKKIFTADIIHACMHGGIGEGGGYQGFFDTLDIPYTGCTTLAASISMDKVVMKQLFQHNDIPVSKYLHFYHNQSKSIEDQLPAELDSLQYPLFVKPAKSGSSIGVTKVNDQKELAEAVEVASLFDPKVIIEEAFTDAGEYNISVIGRHDGAIELSPIEQVFSKGAMLDFENKYVPDGSKSPKTSKLGSGKTGMSNTQRELPAKLSDEQVTAIKQSAEKVFRACNCTGLVRIDFLVKEDSTDHVVIEVNTLPGDMSYYLWEAANKSFTDINTQLIILAEDYYNDTRPQIDAFRTDILKYYKES